MRISRTLLLACILAGCRSAPPGAAGGASASLPDSIVLERGLCFGICPAYRLSVSRAGAVHFRSRNPGDTARVASATIPPERFRALAAEADRIGFDRFPASIAGSALCKEMVTDLPHATVSLFRGGGVKRVEDYHGCLDGPKELRRFQVSIDSVAGSSRWVRPAKVR